MDSFTTEPRNPRQRERFHIPLAMGFCIFLAIAVFLLLREHRAHFLGLLPYGLLLLCPLVHLFMHRGHGDHDHSSHQGDNHRDHGEGGLS